MSRIVSLYFSFNHQNYIALISITDTGLCISFPDSLFHDIFTGGKVHLSPAGSFQEPKDGNPLRTKILEQVIKELKKVYPIPDL